MRSEAQVALGIEADRTGERSDGPAKMGPGELRALGHMPIGSGSGYRAHWAVRATEVSKCTAVRCPSWPFRLGANPWRAPLSEAERARRRERKARFGKRAGKSPCPSRRSNRAECAQATARTPPREEG